MMDALVGRMIAALLAALVLWKWPRKPPAGQPSRTMILVLLAVSTVLALEGPATVAFFTSSQIRIWNTYHYYMGSKYFRELGYRDLYDATLAADAEGPQLWNEITTVRDQRTYRFRERAAYDPAAHFTPARWRQFRTDVAALQPLAKASKWQEIVLDRGYNPSPFWTLVGGGLANAVPITHVLGLKLLCGLDLLLLLGSFALLWWSYGAEKAAIALLLFAIHPANNGRLVGGFLQYDWFFATVGAFALYHRGKRGWAGVLLAHAILTRIFPILILLAGAVPMLALWLRQRRLRWRPWSRLAAACALACAVGVGASAAYTGGVDSWVSFTKNLEHHASEHEGGERRVGLGHLLASNVAEAKPGEPLPPADSALRVVARWGIAGGMLLLLLVVLRRRNSHDAMILGLCGLFAVAVTSRYYWSYLALVPLLSATTLQRQVRLRNVEIGILLAYAVLGACLGFDVWRFYSYIIFNGLLLLVLLGWLLSYLRPLRRRALRVEPS